MKMNHRRLSVLLWVFAISGAWIARADAQQDLVVVDVAVAVDEPAVDPAAILDAALAPIVGQFLQAKEVVLSFATGVPPDAEAPAAQAFDAELNPHMVQFRPVLQAELSFANRICDFTEEQRWAAIKAGKESLQDFVRQYLKEMNQPQQMVAVGFRVAQAAIPTDPRSAIEQRVAAVVKEIVTPDQLVAYEGELVKREKFRRRVAAENIVAKIDQQLSLSAEQRQTITDSLTLNWDASWGLLDGVLQSGEYLPQIPDPLVVPHLTASQEKAWQNIQKVSFGIQFLGNEQWINVTEGIDDIDLDEAE